MKIYNPNDWFWIVGGDGSRWWSSRAGAYIKPDQAWLDSGGVPTRIASETELVEVLNQYGLVGPLDKDGERDLVRAECRRRLMRLVGARDAEHLDVLISNGNREAIRLLNKGMENWSAEDQARSAFLIATDAAIEAIRAASNVLEVADPIPDDFTADKHWPQ